MEKISVIIPVFNGGGTLEACLDSIYRSHYPNYEVILVDDASIDNSIEIAKNFPCKIIKLKKNSGPSTARNAGAKKAKGEVLLFIDADTKIQDNTLSLVRDSLKNEGVCCVTGVVKKEKYEGIINQYRNLWEHFEFFRYPERTILPATFLCAIWRKYFEEVGRFDENVKNPVDDREFGWRLVKFTNSEIRLDKKIVVEHQINYSLFSFLKRQYRLGFYWIKTFLKKRKSSSVGKKEIFFTLQRPINVLLTSLLLINILLSLFFHLNLIFFGFLIILPILGLITLNFKFLHFLKKERGFFFPLLSLVIILTENFSHILGISVGLISFIKDGKKN